MSMDETYMKTALQLAQSVKGQTDPNPPVGAVIVKNNRIIGLGAHLQAGEAHAEVHAINMAGKEAENATIYVTLEPCSHIGKTPSCADLIIKNKLARVVIATKDPNELVAGEGIKRLKEAGIDVTVGLLEEEATHINDVFFHYIKTNRPFVTVKSATSLDGKIATKTGESKWITSELAREDVHYYRHTHEAILVGVNTVLQDNPRLTTRLKQGGKNPIRIVLDTNLNTPLNAHLIQNSEADTIIFVSTNVLDEKIAQFNEFNHVEIIQLPTEKIKISDVLKVLGEREIASLFVEGGATINDAFLRAGFINQFVLYLAPKLIGGKKAPTSFSGKGYSNLKDIFNLKITYVEKIGPDIKISAVPKGE